LAITDVRAEELLVMPFACSVVGGEGVLTPSGQQGYRILGERTQLPFTACSPAAPGRCRRWTLQRFDIDCDGVRLPWVSLAAAAARQANARAWTANGQLHLQMPPRWTMADGDPCAGPPGYPGGYPPGYPPDYSGYDGRWRADGLARYCFNRRINAPPGVVEMPVGFAPTFGIGVFVASGPPGAAGSPASTAPSSAHAPVGGAQQKTARAEVPRQPAPPQREVPEKEAVAKPPAKVEKTPPPTPRTERAPPVVPRLLNPSDPAPQVTPAPPETSAEIPQQTPAPGPEQAKDPPAPGPEQAKDAPVQTGEPPVRTAERGGHGTSLGAVLTSRPAAAVVAAAGLAALVLAAFALMRQREQTRLNVAALRDASSLSLDGPPKQVPLARSAPNPTSPRAATAPGFGDSIPVTLKQALQVLGMGVRAEASETAIKKIVDGLRMSWHPDYADGPADRILRELRTKQINAAWDIIRSSIRDRQQS
jgi:hypothetical protein